eukprot:m.123660 g.123660  ORF g.123660 m.123660 type:complete len:238 (+) comp19709_c0_seq1:506-1219(+)
MGGCVSWLKGLFKPKQKQVVFRRMRHEEDSEDENVEITTTLLTKEEMDEDNATSMTATPTASIRSAEDIEAQTKARYEQMLAEQRRLDEEINAELARREEDLRLEEEAFVAEKRAAAQRVKAGLTTKDEDSISTDSAPNSLSGVSISSSTGTLDDASTRSDRSRTASINSNSLPPDLSAAPLVQTSAAAGSTSSKAPAADVALDSDDDFDAFLENVKSTTLSGSRTDLNPPGLKTLS